MIKTLPFFTPKSPLDGIALSRDKKHALFSGVYNDLLPEASSFFLWDLAKGEIVRNVIGVGYSPTLSSDGSLGLVAAYDDRNRTSQIKLWDLSGLKLLNTFAVKGATKQLSFSDDDKVIYSLGDSFASWDVRTGKLLNSFELSEGRGLPLAFSRDKRFFITMNDAGAEIIDIPFGAVGLWNLTTGKLVKELDLRKEIFKEDAFQFSPNGQRLAIGGQRMLRIWDLESNKLSIDLAANLPIEFKTKPRLLNKSK